MDYHCSEELELTRSMVSDFAAKRIAPSATQRDEEERFDRRLMPQLGELGLVGIPWPEQYGGAGSDLLTFTVAMEEISKACASTGAILSAHVGFAAWPILAFGSEELKLAHLSELARGTKLGSGVFPSFRRHDTANFSCITYRSEDGRYVLNGECRHVPNVEEADLYVVFAKGEGRRGGKGTSVFVVERGTMGLEIGSKDRTLGLRSRSSGDIRLNQCSIPKQNRIGKAGQGSEIALSILDLAHLSASAQAVGIAQGAMEAAAGYALERKQFGQLIGRHQGILFKLADMAARVEAGRLLNYQAAWCHQSGLSYRKEAALAWKFTAEMAAAITVDAVQVLGGYGYMQEYQVERYMRDAKCLEADFGMGGWFAEEIERMLAECQP
ncbi:acyl-CoA dehydrogenase family protein [Paenibacillus mendelii]|uniref:Acyl-CoA dehydrogenase family protein n=1 Tax=Paenibacillus mendelii TaxID=206163 RepID=A0ABV6JG50_9BACL|nr:acyl-CoA dehydrogenase family protein [Paenibacillus mendelii]MCQ6557755.1 acyl-CoA dehydrogenase family protein [Paenibacillus mendelii]